MKTGTCARCGGVFQVEKPSQLRKRKYCSPRCHQLTALDRPVDSFWRRVDKSGDCWLWQGAKIQGYGVLSFRSRRIRAHRLSYELAHGEFDQSLYVCHRCDNPKCVRPEHLFLGTAQDNMADCVSKGRQHTFPSVTKGERNGRAVLTAEMVREIRRRHQGGVTYKQIAQEMGVDRRTVADAGSGRHWAHLEMACHQ